MGYRSTVAYTIRFTALPSPQEAEGGKFPSDQEIQSAKGSFYTFLADAKVKFPSAMSDEAMTIDEKNLALNFFASDVKWYESYEDVKCHMELLQLAQDWAENVDEENGNTKGNKHIGGIFVRIGEETDDITEEFFGEYDWDWLRVHREVHFDWEV